MRFVVEWSSYMAEVEVACVMVGNTVIKKLSVATGTTLGKAIMLS